MGKKTELDLVFESVSKDQLKILLNEYLVFKEVGHLAAESELRKFTQKVSDISGNKFSTEIIGVTFKLMEKAALMWLVGEDFK